MISIFWRSLKGAPGFTVFRNYWAAYGGWRELLHSPYFQLALLINSVMVSVWANDEWWTTPIGVLPTLIGFTMTGYAIILRFTNDEFSRFLAETYHNNVSFLDALNNTIFHFIFLKFLALLAALVGQSSPLTSAAQFLNTNIVPMPSAVLYAAEVATLVFSFLAHLVFVYAIFAGVAALAIIYKTSEIYNQWLSASKRN